MTKKLALLLIAALGLATSASASNRSGLYQARVQDGLELGGKAKSEIMNTPCGGNFDLARAYVASQEGVITHLQMLVQLDEQAGESVDRFQATASIGILRAYAIESRSLLNRKLQYCQDKPVFENTIGGNGVER